MRKLKRRLKGRELMIKTSPKVKMSDLISEYASDYINMGEDTEERQDYLNRACTAWNIAIQDKEHREGALGLAVESYKKMNPGSGEAGSLEHDLRILIKKKVDMFPEIRNVIIDAMIEPISETKYQIDIASSDDKELLKEIFEL